MLLFIRSYNVFVLFKKASGADIALRYRMPDNDIFN